MQKKKVLLGILALVLVAAISVGGTLAWMTHESGTVTNTFTSGKVEIELKEHELKPDHVTLDTDKEVEANDHYKLIPGRTAAKDPFVRVKEGSEDCWIFVRVVEENNTFEANQKIVEWAVSGEWVHVEGQPENVFACKEKKAAGSETYILNENQVKIADGYTGLTDETKKPVIKFMAYAIQAEGFDTAAEAWAAAPDAWKR